MATCDECKRQVSIRYVVGSQKLCEECYGEPRIQPCIDKSYLGQRPVFDPYFDHALGTHCISYRDQERKVKEFNDRQRNLPPDQRDKAHPEGFTFVNDDKKFMRELKHISRHKKEVVYERFKKRGKDPASLTATQKKWYGWRNRGYLITLVLLLSASLAHADLLQGVSYVPLTVNDYKFKVPMYNKHFQTDFVLIKRAVEQKDSVSREILIGDANYRAFYVSDGITKRWLMMYPTHDEVWEFRNGEQIVIGGDQNG